MEWAWIIPIPLFIVYAIQIFFYLKGWNRSTRFQMGMPIEPKRRASIIIPVRNEADHIGSLLKDLKRQRYPDVYYEIILIDDHSTDQTRELVSRHVSTGKNIRLIELGNGEYGKKAAIGRGILHAKYDIIVSTDGDCRAPEGWLERIMAGFEEPGIRMVAGPVLMEPDSGWFGGLQSLEFLSLVGVSAGSAALNNPILCNAANLAYLKEDYLDYQEAQKIRSPSGDDIFLMLWLKKNRPRSIRYISFPEAAIRTLPAENLGLFIMQRLRWASKSRNYRDIHIIGTALLVYLVNASLLLAVIMSFFMVGWAILFGSMFLVKCLVDLIFLEKVLRHYAKRKLLLVFLPLELIYFLYVSIVGMASQLVLYTWKERNIRP